MDCERDVGLIVRHDVLFVPDGVSGLVRHGCVPFFKLSFLNNDLFMNIAHFSENWGYLCASSLIASSVFALAFGRILDAHQGPNKESLLSLRSGPVMQCTQGKECYVAALYMTAGACFVAVLLSVWAALRDRRKIKDGVEEARSRREVGWEGGYSEE